MPLSFDSWSDLILIVHPKFLMYFSFLPEAIRRDRGLPNRWEYTFCRHHLQEQGGGGAGGPALPLSFSLIYILFMLSLKISLMSWRIASGPSLFSICSVDLFMLHLISSPMYTSFSLSLTHSLMSLTSPDENFPYMVKILGIEPKTRNVMVRLRTVNYSVLSLVD